MTVILTALPISRLVPSAGLTAVTTYLPSSVESVVVASTVEEL